MVGRSDEMSRLGRALDRALSGLGTTVLLAGEAGVGKTRLLTEFVSARGAGTTVLVGSCLDLSDGAPPYWAIMDALRALPEDLIRTHLHHTYLSPGRPGLAHPQGLGQDPGEAAEGPRPAEPSRRAQEQLFESVLAALQQAARRRPIVLIIEDLHWADRSTRDLLTFLAGTLASSPVLFIGSYRSDALMPGHPLQAWLAECLRNAGAQLIELRRLNRHEVTLQITGILGGPPRPDVAAAIWSRSEGNAFFAEELLASVVAGQSDLPPTLRQVLLARIGMVSAPAGQVLGMVATAGSPVRHELLVALGTMAEADILRAVRECVDHQILLVDTRVNGYAFRHNLLRDAVDEQLFPAERAALHRACARALQADPRLTYGSAAAEEALHWYRAGDAERALPAAVEAAEAAAATFGFPEAQAHLERALDLWASAPQAAAGLDRLDLALRTAEFANLVGEHQRAVELVRAAADRLDPAEPAARAAPAWERLGRYLWDAGASEDALVAYERAAELVTSDPFSVVGARVLGAQAGALMLAGRYQESRRRAEEALDLARRMGARREEAQVLAVLGFDLAYLGDPGGEQLLLEARRIADEDGDADGVARAYLHLGTLLSEPLNRLTDAIAVAEEGLQAVARLGLERFHGVALRALVVNTMFRLGRWHEGEQRLRDAFERQPAGTAAIDLLLARARLGVSTGRFATATEDLDRVGELAARAIDPRFHAPVLTLRAGMNLWLGRLDDARAAVGAGLASLTASQEVWFAGPLAWHGLWAEADRAELVRGQRSGEEMDAILATADALMERLRQLMQRLDPAASAVHRTAGLYLSMCLAEQSRLRGASSPELWEAAAANWDRMEQPYPAAYCRWRLAEAMLSLRARSVPAATALRAAHTTSLALGAVSLQARIEGLAERAGISLEALVAGRTLPGDGPRSPVTEMAPVGATALGVAVAVAPEAGDRAAKGAALGLTARETQVLCLVAQGRTNREVAASLFISEKTASDHVSNILRKLELRSRVEASGLAHRLGLLDPATPR